MSGRDNHPLQIGRDTLRRTWAVVATLFVTGCSIETRATFLEPGVRRPPTCAAGVVLFQTLGEISRPYHQIARLRVWQSADMIATPAAQQSALRKKAAEVGANGLVLGHRLDELQTSRQHSVAIVIPEDSARTAAACQAPAK